MHRARAPVKKDNGLTVANRPALQQWDTQSEYDGGARLVSRVAAL
jgi:hypothetical protein